MKRVATTTSKNKNVSKKISKEEILPDWFDKELDTDNSNKEESEELDKIINSLV